MHEDLRKWAQQCREHAVLLPNDKLAEHFHRLAEKCDQLADGLSDPRRKPGEQSDR
jgi:hypothetical protein